MPTALEELLGQDGVASDIVEVLRGGTQRLVRLTGASGAGKTYTALLAAAKWRYDGGRVLIATGDEAKGDRELFPLLALEGLSSARWPTLAAQGSRSVLSAAETVVGTGGIGTSVFDLLASALGSRMEVELRYLSPRELQIVADIQREARSRPLLLIADSAHYWDAASLSLLDDLLSTRLQSAVSSLENLSVLLVDSAQDQGVASPVEFERLARIGSSTSWEMELVERQQFGLVLQHLGLQVDLKQDTLKELHDITGGHLEVVTQLVAELSEETGAALATADPYPRDVSALLEARLRSLGSSGAGLTALLQRAAVIGATFALAEIECLASGTREDINRLVERAAEIRFVEAGPEWLRFRHDILRSHFLETSTPSELRRLRSQHEKCLSVLRPHDYAARADLLLQAGDFLRGREIYALAAIAALRDGSPSGRVLADAAAQFLDDAELHDYLGLIASAYEAIAAGDYRTFSGTLRTSIASETMLMAAERNYLLALCLMESETVAGFVEARQILGQWHEEIAGEPELALRFLLLRQQAEVFCEEFDAARSTESTIEMQLLRRPVTDASAPRLRHVQNRRAAAVNRPETAETRISAAVEFFRRTAGEHAGDALELYKALNNHAAILIKLSRDADALVAAKEAERLLLDRPALFPRPDVLAGNLILAARRADSYSLSIAIARQEAIVRSPQGSSDGFIHKCNLASYLLQARRDEEAHTLILELTSDVEQHAIAETYLIYYWHVLRVSAALVGGNRGRARELHDHMASFVDRLKWPNAPYVQRRHLVLDGLLDTIDPDEPRDRLEYAILDNHPEALGPGWAYHARLFPCCELSFWSDS